MKWVIDSSHTSLQLAVKHMGISTVRGQFKKVSGTVESGDDGTLRLIEGVIDAGSIDTAEPKRDGQLRAGANATGRINRKDWGLTWNQVLELGALLVGEEVQFTLDVEAYAPVAAPAAA